MIPLSAIEKTLGSKEGVCFKELPGGMTVIEIDTPLATASLSLYGGQVLTWQPKTQASPVLWASNLVKYLNGKAIRAGIPICWPWFGAHPAKQDFPGHGYARITNWKISSIDDDEDGTIKICLALGDSDLASIHWGSKVSLELKVIIGSTLDVELTTRNKGMQEIEFTEGLHTYFHVSDISNVEVLGLEGADYIDLVNQNESRTQCAAISFDGEVGRIFLENYSTCIIRDEGLKRCISIEKSGSKSTAVWNPGLQIASKMDDLGSLGWRNMVCVESANALTDKITLAGNHSHKHHVIYSVSPL
ncbi:D-hexose-6-phosphate mutarotase [Polynucleobacter asymbioticus]|uniref:D-hexose-6-phosphate mutarotase n=1 Tax=Polynucleobacter asymbioticus TaxID=576611 RepID=UPI0008F8C087|nr:D-hexose-6-phosphate mutarotase [Polynucleobacter asymbioticus]